MLKKISALLSILIVSFSLFACVAEKPNPQDAVLKYTQEYFVSEEVINIFINEFFYNDMDISAISEEEMKEVYDLSAAIVKEIANSSTIEFNETVIEKDAATITATIKTYDFISYINLLIEEIDSLENDLYDFFITDPSPEQEDEKKEEYTQRLKEIYIKNISNEGSDKKVFNIEYKLLYDKNLSSWIIEENDSLENILFNDLRQYNENLNQYKNVINETSNEEIEEEIEK